MKYYNHIYFLLLFLSTNSGCAVVCAASSRLGSNLKKSNAPLACLVQAKHKQAGSAHY